MKKKVLVISLLVTVLVLMTACGGSGDKGSSKKDPAFLPDGEWIVYWDAGSPEDYTDLTEEVVLFSCFYKEDGSLFVPDALDGLVREIPMDRTVYLSFTNDVKKAGGETVQKSTKLLRQLLAGDPSARSAASDMIKIAKAQEADGVELDFENLGSGDTLWGNWLTLVRQLNRRASRAGLKVRVVLPAVFPKDPGNLPDGPEYTVMCYNLHGIGTEPGPKADSEFLRKTAKRYRSLSDVRFALAGGGFDWRKSGSAVSVTTKEAVRLVGGNARRDKESRAMHGTYTKNKVRHTVWYADDTTLKAWKKELQSASGRQVKIDLWRREP